MLISSATGLVLDRSVNRYKGFAILAISITGIAGSIGAIQYVLTPPHPPLPWLSCCFLLLRAADACARVTVHHGYQPLCMPLERLDTIINNKQKRTILRLSLVFLLPLQRMNPR